MPSSAPPTGLVVLRASRLEALVPPLQRLLEETRPPHPLEPQTLIAAHPGMKQWLGGALARQVGAGRIVANLEMVLPSTWLDRLSTRLLGERAVALPRYRRGPLRWSLHRLLGEAAAHGITDARVQAYLDAPGSADLRAQRRLQLADRLATLFSQYLVYRSDWLAAWEAGVSNPATAALADPALRALEAQALAPLWRALAAALGGHRGRLARDLLRVLQEPSQGLEPLHVFGLSHLPPVELAVLHAYARHALVAVYVPDPCREYWGGLHRGLPRGDGREADAGAWRAFREDEAARLADPEALDWREQGHPLLARWGRLGQHFFAALTEAPLREDIRHWQDEADTAPSNRLQRLQESLRRLQPELIGEDPRDPAARADASLRVHACHTRLRELEVLRDALLDAIDRDGVRPGEIVVMAPDLRAYLPLLPAVFGEPGSTRERLLPYHLADVPVARSHPLFAVVETLLGLGASRLGAPEVADLLGVAEVRRALSLDDGAADELLDWLRASRVAWGLDGRHKAGFGLPPRAEHSFAWALDRMLAGYLMAETGGDDAPVQLADGTTLLPQGGIHGPGAAALGGLDRLLCELQAWRDLAEVEQAASAWAAALRLRVDALLRIDPGDAAARAALDLLHRAIDQVAAEPAANGLDPPLRLAVVRELLREALDAAPERQRFLMGGITFCGMVPQRAVPFAVVAVLGLDEEQFPRRPAHGGMDLMATLRRLGDRDVPSDDRYLFLETVMAARRRLHLSFVGQGVRDGKHRNPAAPLAELLAELDRHAGFAPDDAESARPWLLRHPLQPFDARYFDGRDPALFSYSAAFAGMRGEGRGALPGLRDGEPLRPEPLPETVPLARLEAFFKDPARALLRDHLQLSLEALDPGQRLDDEEPLDAIPRIAGVARRVFLDEVLPRHCADPAWTWPATPPAWLALGGLLPPGPAGLAAWAGEAKAVEAMLACAAALGRFDANGATGAQSRTVEVVLAEATATEPPLRLAGRVDALFPLAASPGGLQLVFAFPGSAKSALKPATDLGHRELVPAFLRWAALRLHATGEPAPVRLTLLAAGDEPSLAVEVNAWDAAYCAADDARRAAMAAGLRQRLHGLIAVWARGRDGATLWYPRSAAKALARRPADPAGIEAWIAAAAKEVAKTWRGDFQTGERDQEPGYARWLEGELVFGDPATDPDHAALRSLLEDTLRIEALIRLGDAATPACSGEDAA